MAELSVAHRPEQGKFEIVGDGKSQGYLDYSFSDKGTVCIDYVQVAPALRGKQMGNKLVDAAVEWARANGHSVIARCSFARAVLNRSNRPVAR